MPATSDKKTRCLLIKKAGGKLEKARRVKAYIRHRAPGQIGGPIMVPEHSDVRPAAKPKAWMTPAPKVSLEQHLASPMVYTGDRPGPRLSEELRARGWGIMSITGKPPPNMSWAFDNGAFGATRTGIPWSGRDYLNRLYVAMSQPRPPDFLVVPDVPILGPSGADVWTKPGVSLRSSLEWMHSGALPYHIPWYLAVQDGMTVEEVADLFDEGDLPIAGIFLGGSNEFKAGTAADWARMAHDRGIAFHYARSSTQRKIRHAFDVGADSMDSAQMLRSADEWRKTTQAFYGSAAQGSLQLP